MNRGGPRRNFRSRRPAGPPTRSRRDRADRARSREIGRRTLARRDRTSARGPSRRARNRAGRPASPTRESSSAAADLRPSARDIASKACNGRCAKLYPQNFFAWCAYANSLVSKVPMSDEARRSVAENSARDHDAVHRPSITIVAGYGVLGAIEPARRPLGSPQDQRQLLDRSSNISALIERAPGRRAAKWPS